MRSFYIVLKAISFLVGSIGGFLAFLNDSISLVPQGMFGLTEDEIRLAGIISFLVSVFIFMIVSLLQDITKEISLPKIKALTTKPVWEPKEFKGGIWRDALYVEFKNFGGDAALFVAATVKWKSASGESLPDNHGRWHITNRRIDQGEPLEYVDILPNNLEHRLHFGIKSPDGKKMYAWYRIKDEQAEIVELTDERYEVEIVLTDSHRTKWKYKYWVENDGTTLSESRNKKPKKAKQKKTTPKKVGRIIKAPPVSINSST